MHSGSIGIVVPGKPLALPDPCTIVMRVQPWLPDGRQQTVLAIDSGPTFWLTAGGAGLAIGGREVRVAAPMLKRRWYELRIVAEAGRVHLRQTGLQRNWGVIDSGEAELIGSLGALGIIAFAAMPDPTPGPGDNPYGSFFNGRIEDLAILTGARHAPAPIGAGRGGLPRVVGFQPGYPERAHRRPRTAGAAWQPAQPADAGGLRLAVDRR